MLVAAVQMNSSADLEQNLLSAEKWLRVAHGQGARLAVLPENFAFMGRDERDKIELAEIQGDGRIQDFLAGLATELRLWIVAGTIPLQSSVSGKVVSACLVFDDRGRIAARYDKIHLFDVSLPGRDERYRESATVAAGTMPVCVDTPVGRLGLSVCYDLRFPELFRRLLDMGAQWFSVPSAFTAATGRAHWEVLLRARAVENLCYVVAPAQSGLHDNARETHGDSMIIDPWGHVLGRLPDGPGTVLGDIDLVAQRDLRQNFPSVEHRRLTS